jgi:hypothetical protein
MWFMKDVRVIYYLNMVAPQKCPMSQIWEVQG